MKKLLVTLLKITISLAILGYLFWAAAIRKDGGVSFYAMLSQPKRWDLLAAAWGVATAAVIITMVRWCYLCQTVGISFPLSDALRIGFLGYLFNYAPMGMFGGDLLKAVIIAKEHPGNRPKAVASIIVDRIIGLYVLFLLATAAIFLTGFWNLPLRDIHVICIAVLVVTIISTLGIALLLLPGVLESRWLNSMSRIPKLGRAIGGLLEGFRFYRENRFALLMGCLMSVPVHGLLALSIYLVALGLRFIDVPCSNYFTIYSVSGIASTIPLPAGPVESGIVFFYVTALRAVTEVTQGTAEGQGLIVALAYRLVTVLIAPIGLGYYLLGGRREVVEVMHDEQG